MYKAHTNNITNEIQTIKEHSYNTANLCYKFSIPILKDIMYIIGLLHDVGKYQISFQNRINGKNIKVEHSTCGAIVVKDRYSNENQYKDLVSWIMMYCISGHHSGIPNGGNRFDDENNSTLYGRLKRNFEDYSQYMNELELSNFNELNFYKFLVEDCKNKDMCIDKFAFIVRYCFSCLVDADSIDTANFCNNSKISDYSLNANFEKCLLKVNNTLKSFVCKTDLQKYRSIIQNQVYKSINNDANIYIMNMPTGAGKTLCSIKFALERAIKNNKERIIYVIPYNSIIEQTAEVFENIFGNYAEILRHQSTFTYDDYDINKNYDFDEDYKKILKFATENWNAKIIMTTTVQFFESIHSNKRSKLRKLHNISDSIIVFDEVHRIPENYLQPCIESISYITKYLNSEAVFLTATMPDFYNLIDKYSINVKIKNLIDDTSLFKYFEKCKYENLGVLSKENIIEKAKNYPSSLIIVNKKKTSREFYNICQCQCKKYYLSTYMTAFDRINIINEIKLELKKLEIDYPNFENVPENRKVIVISTSLIEAGVDLDFYVVFRELSGLDSILQSGGRCNREGKRNLGDVYIFEIDEEKFNVKNNDLGIRVEITKNILKNFNNISSKESVEEYYKQLFFLKENNIIKNSMYQYSNDYKSIPFEEYAKNFNIIDEGEKISIVVANNQESISIINNIISLGFQYENMRKLQKYVVSINISEFNQLKQQNVIENIDNTIYYLTNNDYYSKEVGIEFESKDYFI